MIWFFGLFRRLVAASPIYFLNSDANPDGFGLCPLFNLMVDTQIFKVSNFYLPMQTLCKASHDNCQAIFTSSSSTANIPSFLIHCLPIIPQLFLTVLFAILYTSYFLLFFWVMKYSLVFKFSQINNCSIISLCF